MTAISREAIFTPTMLSRAKLRALRRTPSKGRNRLKTAITLMGTTQVQVAEAVGVAQSQVSEDAAGKYEVISLDKARAYAEFFGCAIEDLFPAEQAMAS